MQTVTSKDTTKIAYDKRGTGPAVVLVDPALCFRESGPMPALAEALSKYFTVFNYDRRGRGESGDTLPFALDREIEDIEALIDEAGGSAYLYGHSSGAALAMEAALKLGPKVKKLAMYEAPYNLDQKGKAESEKFNEQIKQLLDAGRRSDAVKFLLDGVGMPEEVLKGMMEAPTWPKMEALAHTILYDSAATGTILPFDHAAGVEAPTLVMYGTASYDFMRAVAEKLKATIPGAKLRVLEGQGHDADPQVLTPILREFFLETHE